jgi:bifunctional DNA-binding transcriptional regulator/antitoxin component of YhaV-PrlF toxin-antitoxin module
VKRTKIVNVPEIAGETTLTSRNQVSLPAKRMRELGWEKGDRLIVQVLGENMLLLVRRPASWTDAFAGRLTHVFGTHEENIEWIEGERASWSKGDAG